MKSGKTLIDTTNNKVYVQFEYISPAYKVIDTYGRISRLTSLHTDMLIGKFKANQLKMNTLLSMEFMTERITRIKTHISEGIAEYKQTGQFDKLDEYGYFKSIPNIPPKLEIAKNLYKYFNSLLPDIQLKYEEFTSKVPKIISNLYNYNDYKEQINTYTKLAYVGIAEMDGALCFDPPTLLGNMYVYRDGGFLMSKIILKKFLEYYIREASPLRKTIYSIRKGITLTLKDLVVTTDAEGTLITDLLCPGLFLVNNDVSPLSAFGATYNVSDTGVNMTINNTSLGSVNLEEPLVKVRLSINPDEVTSPGEVVKTSFWKNEFNMVIRIILALSLLDYSYSNTSKEATAIEQLVYYLSLVNDELLTMTSEQMETLIAKIYENPDVKRKSRRTQDSIKFASQVCSVFMRPVEEEDGQLIRDDFGRDLQIILDTVVNQYV